MNKISIQKFKTYWQLGIFNLVWVVVYRLALKIGLFERMTRRGGAIKGPFFVKVKPVVDPSLDSVDLRVFGWYEYAKTTPPDWGASIISGIGESVQGQHWSAIPDFALKMGDIKTVWDLSRFDWLLYFVVEYLKTGDDSYIDTLNLWLEDWSEKNPVNQGINWKCGQEASIRVMHLCLSVYLLQQHTKLLPGVVNMLRQHLERISPTVLYAMAQDNNHGTSEAVALYIGGLALGKKHSDSKSTKWKRQGRKWIENRVKRLIMSDGSFSQHSVNYHRVMLDSLCLAEFFRRKFTDDEFSPESINKLRLATDWLRCFTDKSTGDTPNLGANDGARLIPLSNTGYRDYRPTVQLASALFFNKKCYAGSGPFNQPLKLLSLNVNQYLPVISTNRDFKDGGYIYIRKEKARLFMRYPVFKFRPAQCDVFHVDFWLKGRNILRDAGSYSYNIEKKWLDYFPGTEAHNTIQFDQSEQMPRLSRFLYSHWLKTSDYTGLYERGKVTGFKAGYKKPNALEHNREVNLSDRKLTIIDNINGFKKMAVMRWRLPPGNYDILGQSIISDDFKLVVISDAQIKRFELVKGWESRFYMKKTSLPVLEVEVSEKTKIITTLTWV